MPRIVSMEEIEPRRWVAKYQGNYGTYAIRLTVAADGRATDFHCTCPSGGYPCKHIGMIMDAIPEHVAKQKAAAKADKADELSPAKLVAKVPEKELRAFVVAQAAKNAALRKSILMEFAPKAKTKSAANPYARIIRDGLAEVDLDDHDYDDWYDHEEGVALDILDEMLAKAASCIEQQKFDEAILISKACLEEYAEWADAQDCDVGEYVDYSYAERPLQLLRDVVERGGGDATALYDYCKDKSRDAKFDSSYMQEKIHDLMLALAIRANNRDFIAMQDALLAETQDDPLHSHERIFYREIEFYRGVGEHDNADAILQANVHIDSFRMTVADTLIAARKYAEAKSLILRYLDEETWRNTEWNKRLLAIAKAEGDTPKIRDYAWRFIDNGFNGKYYRIYKSTFSASEWTTELERVLNHYAAKKRPHYLGSGDRSDSADMLAEEKLAERLLVMLEKKPHPSSVEHYHKHFAVHFPERTLALFKKAVDKYAAKNVGNHYYDDIAAWLKIIRQLPGGATVFNAMLADYRVTYKRRSAMMRILAGKFG